MLFKRTLLSLFACFFVLACRSQTEVKDNDELLKLEPLVLANNRAKLNEFPWSLAYNKLLSKADKIVKNQIQNITQKSAPSPSGNKHDYVSMAPYWWPDPSKPNGVPYIRKDGQRNPEINSFSDKKFFITCCRNVYTLALAYYFSGNDVYAKKAIAYINTWFVDTATKMNPHLNYAQFIKGKNDGRGAGVIDGRNFIHLIDGLQLIKTSKLWNMNTDTAVKAWFTQYFKWLNTSKIGLDEQKADNNHGVWYDAQALSIAGFLQLKTDVKQIIDRCKGRLINQMDEEGLFPKELQRTISTHYSIFVLKAFSVVHILSKQYGMNWLTVEGKETNTFLKAIKAIIPYLSEEKAWVYKNIKPYQLKDAIPFLYQLKQDCKDEILEKFLQKHQDKIDKSGLTTLILN